MNKVLNLQNEIKKHIQGIIVTLGYADHQFEPLLEEPKDKSNGDYSTNCAMQLTKIAKKAPRLIAEEIIKQFDVKQFNVSKIEIAGPGFINFYMDHQYLTTVINDVLDQNEKYGKSDYGQNEKINIEFVSANPTGDLHLGHARGAAIGDSLCRVLSFAGYDVTREYYINDAGNQIHNLAMSTIARYEQLLGKETLMPEDGYHGEDIKDIAKELVEKHQDQYKDDVIERYDYFKKYAKQYELEKIKRDLKDFKVEFDVWSSEKALYDNNQVEVAIDKLRDKGYIYELDGATWFKSTEFGDDKDRVLRKSDGSLTYLTPDIAYHIDKLSRGFNKMINVLGADHHGYVPRLKAAIECLSGEHDKLEVIIIQMVRLLKNGEEYKMSKRSGKALTIRDLMEEVGTDALRYFFVMRSSDSQMDFDLDLATKKSNENPVYYAQYAHARICSLINQAEEKGYEKAIFDAYHLIDGERPLDLLKAIANFPKVVVESAIKRTPHIITNYVNDLASAFHSFYNAEKVITEDDLKTKQLLALVHATKITLVNSLKLIGVSAPDRM